MPTPVTHVQLIEPLLKVSDYISIAAILLGPVVAIQLQKFIERRKLAHERRENIFKTLMATRGSTLSVSHVEALNRIDLEFSSATKYQAVIAAWKEYFDNLSNRRDTEAIDIWITRNEELLANLLHAMGLSLGYKFDKVLIKRNIYSPVGHGKSEQDQDQIREGLAAIFRGEDSFPVQFVQDEEDIERQKLIQQLTIDHYAAQRQARGHEVLEEPKDH